MADYSYFPSTQNFLDVQAHLLQQCDRWDHALQAFVARSSLDDQKSLRGADLLQSHNWLNRMWILNATSISFNYVPHAGQCAFDAFEPYFGRILSRMTTVVDYFSSQGRDGKPPAFALDSGILAVLFFAAIKCRHRHLRRSFVTLIRRAPRREGLWDAEEMRKVCELVISVEEEPIAFDASALYPPESSRVYDLDIRPRRLNNPDRQYVKLKMKPDGPDGEFIWQTRYIHWYC